MMTPRPVGGAATTPPIDVITDYGFVCGAAKVERAAKLPDGAVCISISGSGVQHVNVYVSAAGRSVRAFKGSLGELLPVGPLLRSLSDRFIAERDKESLKGRRRASRDYNDGYRMGMEDAARIVRAGIPS